MCRAAAHVCTGEAFCVASCHGCVVPHGLHLCLRVLHVLPGQCCSPASHKLLHAPVHLRDARMLHHIPIHPHPWSVCAARRVGETCSAAGLQLLGNGDILSYTDWNEHLAVHGVASAMIGRGALIKPWIFTGGCTGAACEHPAV